MKKIKLQFYQDVYGYKLENWSKHEYESYFFWKVIYWQKVTIKVE